MQRRTPCWALLALALPSLAAIAQNTRTPWDEYHKSIQARNAVAAHGPDLFGDQVNLYNGALSFSTTDISVPGNSSLTFGLTRTFSASSKAVNEEQRRPFADWELDVPRIEGVFGPTWQADRCTSQALPPPITTDNGLLGALRVVTTFDALDYWQGTHAQMPGGGELLIAEQGTPQPPAAPGDAWRWMTSSFTYFRCGITANDGGQGFIAITADGTKYTFDRMAQYSETMLSRPRDHTGDEATPLIRKRHVLYATRVENRFGHWVKYQYAHAIDAPARLTSITAGYIGVPKGGGPLQDIPDGRAINLAYNPQGQIATATVVGTNGAVDRIWQYQYDYSSGANFGSLSAVILPDASKWSIAFKPLANASFNIDPKVQRNCDEPGLVTGVNFAQSVSGTLLHPAGASALFEMKPRRHGRTHVPNWCWGFGDSDPANDVAHYVMNYDALSLTRKQVSGPGEATVQWQYEYLSDTSYATTPQCGNGSGPDACVAPTCTNESCASGRARTTVNGPNGDWQRFSFGNSYRYDEGKLRLVERGTSAANILQSETSAYELAQSGQAFATPVGRSLRQRGDGFDSAYLRPRKSQTIQRDGSSFQWTALNFDVFARSTRIQHQSTLGFSRIEQQGYFDQTTLWVLGQPASTYDESTATFPAQTTYDSTTALPTHDYAFGKLLRRRTYYTTGAHAGLPELVYDGSEIKATRLSGYFRGLPGTVTYHDAASESASINGHGEITSVADATGAVTQYGYDALGRINSIVHPSGDPVAWTPTSISFAPSLVSAYGLPAGHWQRTVTTGNQRAVTYYDGHWRPLLSIEYDAANEAGTRRVVQRSFDHEGRTLFTSYPLRSIAAFNSGSAGISNTYDAIGRQRFQHASSELGTLTTEWQYLSGFQTQVINPRGHSTLTRYQAFSTPTTEFPTQIDSPEGVTTLVSRDVFGKPKDMTRNAVYAGLPITLTRRWVYDQHQRLCKTIEPEAGAEIVDYDAANNLIWKAPGQPYTSNASCDRAAVAASAKINQSFDDRNRPLVTSFGDGSPAISRTWTPDGLPLTVGSSISNWTYQYNKRRLPTKESLALTGINLNGSLNVPLEVNYNYNALGHLSSWDYPGSGLLQLAPNALGEAGMAGPYASGMTYHPNGILATMAYGNGSYRTVTLNARTLPLVVQDSGVMRDEYGYDQNGNINAIIDTHGGDNFDSGRNMVYDGRDRVTGITFRVQPSGPYYPNVTFSYTYDGLDNLRSYTSPPNTPFRNTVSEYDQTTWRLTRVRDTYNPSVNFITYGYDNRGNAISRGAWGTQTFDLGNRMRSMVGQGVSATYDYDGHGRRTLIAEPNAPRRIQFYHQGGALLAEIGINQADTVVELKNYFYQGRNGIAERLRTLSNDVTNYVHSDQIGSPMARSTAYGSVYERTMYELYGLKGHSDPNPPYGTAGLFPDGLGFAGHRVDRVSGLSYMQQRYYDPLAGRFISMDPVTADSDKLFNRYAYAHNNPLAKVDPDGRDAGGIYTNPSTRLEYTSGPAAAKATVFVATEIAKAIPQLRALRYALGVRSGGGRNGGKSEEKSAAEREGQNFDKARETAFKKSGMEDPSKVKFSKEDPETGTITEFKGEDGAKVGYDGPHESEGPYHDRQHISWQSAGKRGSGGAQRGNEPYAGPQHPSRPDEKPTPTRE